jgi:hypothetical protein
MRTLVTFESAAFNTTQTRDYFINPGCFGDDTCRWLMERLRQQGVTTDPEPDQEDCGWYFDFAVPEGEHCCVVGFRPAGSESEPGVWIAWIERERTFLGSLFGGRNRGIASTAVSAIHNALSAPEVANLRWHEKSDFDKGREERGSKEP